MAEIAKDQVPWRTGRIVAFWFIVFWFYGFIRGGIEHHWNTGFEFMVAIVSEGIGAGLIPALIAWGVCRNHNKNIRPINPN